jgi:hypothetical protein
MSKYLKALIQPVFKNFYLKNKSSLNLNYELEKMIVSYLQSESYKLVSNYWNYLNIKNLSQINNKNLEIRLNMEFKGYFAPAKEIFGINWSGTVRKHSASWI